MFALRRCMTQVPRALARPNLRTFATYKSAAPETPLTIYAATSHATSSINHRMFYVNVVLMLFVFDAMNGVLDW